MAGAPPPPLTKQQPTTRPAEHVHAAALTSTLTWQLGEFPLLMIATNLIFLEPSDLRLLGPRQPRANACRSAVEGVADGAAGGAADGATPPAAGDTREAARAMSAAQPGRWARTAATVLLAVQLVLPLRPLLASGLDPLDAVSAALRAPHCARRTPTAACAPPTAACTLLVALVGRCTPSRTRS